MLHHNFQSESIVKRKPICPSAKDEWNCLARDTLPGTPGWPYTTACSIKLHYVMANAQTCCLRECHPWWPGNLVFVLFFSLWRTNKKKQLRLKIGTWRLKCVMTDDWKPVAGITGTVNFIYHLGGGDFVCLLALGSFGSFHSNWVIRMRTGFQNLWFENWLLCIDIVWGHIALSRRLNFKDHSISLLVLLKVFTFGFLKKNWRFSFCVYLIE